MRFTTQLMRHSHSIFLALGAPWLGLTLLACVNTRIPTLSDTTAKSTAPDPTASSGPTAQGDSFKIANVAIVGAAAANGGAAAQSSVSTTTIYIDPSKSTAVSGDGPPMLSTHCAVGGSASSANPKSCVCQFSWSETNGTSGTSVSTPRNVITSVTNAQASLVTCAAPDVYNTEIQDGTTIKVTVTAGPGSTEQFFFTPYSYIKNNNQTVGSFRDAEGHSFDNIMHYACYQQYKRGAVIMSKTNLVNNSKTGEPRVYPYANQFCVQSNAAGGAQGCDLMPPSADYTAQAYYYNFYVRGTEAGDVNQWNDGYACPVIKEALNNPTGNVGGQGAVWPLDTNFALSLGKTPDFNYGVDAFVELANGGSDPISASAKSCSGSASAGNSSTNGFVQACLGFAAKPNPDGTCPYFKDASGQIRFTFRLRKLIAIYPPVFGMDGKAPATSQASDTIYVLDRQVKSPLADPLKPYTMRGPKPCPFALFDKLGVTGQADPLYGKYQNVLPGYNATSSILWNGTNVDGTQFPNTDSAMSCSMALPLVKSDPFNFSLNTISLGTVNANNPTLPRLYVRPITAWAPHYEEDLDFQACAPQAQPLRDPPLHFAKDPTTGNVAWCAESYPSQNDNVPNLDKVTDPASVLSANNPYIGHVQPFTSHAVKNSASAACLATIPASIPSNDKNGNLRYPAASVALCPVPPAIPAPSNGVARHPTDLVVDSYKDAANAEINTCSNKTCDRTAIPTGGQIWASFPLLAQAYQTENAISSDTTYGCVVTWDGGGPKTGKKTPQEGCCGANVQMRTGLDSAPYPYNLNAHLEPDTACLTPNLD
ncbi:hypothetical protein WDW37_10330 [Bdellovibrionota bacterium FG-1]